MSQQKNKTQIVIKKSILNKEIMYEENIIIYKGKDKVGEIDIQIMNKYQMKKKINNEIEKDLINKEDNKSENNLKYLKDKSDKIDLIFNIEKLYVDSKYQNQSYATKLMNFTIERYKETNKTKKSMMILTRTQIGEVTKEKLSTIYEKFGFSNNIKQKNGIFMFNDLENINIKVKNQKIKKDLSNGLLLY